MSTTINIMRIGTRLKELFEKHLDMSDVNNEKQENKNFETRALAAVALMIKSGIDVPSSCLHITDGYHDMGIDAIYLDETQKQLFLVQSKWRQSGRGSVSQEEMCSFVEGIKRIINFDLNGSNTKIQAKRSDIDLALQRIGYQITIHNLRVRARSTKKK